MDPTAVTGAVAAAPHADLSIWALFWQADLVVISGTVTDKMAPAIRRLYEQMPEPKWCISMGACASCGGIFDTYAMIQGIDRFVPVDVYIPGCPPRPESLIDAVIKIQELVKLERLDSHV